VLATSSSSTAPMSMREIGQIQFLAMKSTLTPFFS